MENFLNNNLSQSATIWAITIAALFLIMLYGVIRNIKQLSDYRKLMTRRIRELRLSKMLGRLNIPVNDYYRNTTELDKERHIRHCKACPNPEACDCMLLGEDIDPNTFCPNFKELSKL